ncbi:tryptophan ABC transporter substrate-binding protein [Periweissella fabalis]|uniref:ABC transporter substrate-binding protein n=1 Tax=Periweissella fabalis TaxID=1070421 RepID=A0A7X6S3Q7_9LACO|nr:tryptophan ABC transporter substrate-binding protein [Periweissella fabalis]MCM0599699.1 ABC transporter substrate-binding protein [Periweissella fabalis]NKZ24888.1 ABC transporter substrate-binding protein [Periweissella fabalis]
MKRLFLSIGIILAILVGAFFGASHSNNEATSQKKIPTIGILQFLTHPALDAIHRGMVDELAKEGYVDGKTIHIDFQNAQGNQSNLKSMATKFDNENADLSVGIATPAAQVLANTVNGKVLFAPSTNPVAAGLVTNLEHPGNHVTGVSDQAPLKEQLALIKKFVPHLRTLGIIYTSSDISATTEAKAMTKLATKAGLKTKIYTIAQSNDLAQVAQTMAHNQDIDAVFVPTDNTIASSMPVLLQATDSAKMPVFPTASTMVQAGGIAAVSINQYQIGVTTGKMIAKILHGQTINDTPVEFMKKGELVINVKAAQKLGIHIPADSLKQAAAIKGGLIK